MKLKNKKHEAFAQAVADGESAVNAYRLAISSKAKASTAMVDGCRLLKNPNVALRITELRKQASDVLEHKIGMTKEGLMRVLVEIIETPPEDVKKTHRLAERWRKLKSGEELASLPSKLDAANLLADMCGWRLVTKAQQDTALSLESWARGLLNSLPQAPGLPTHGDDTGNSGSEGTAGEAVVQ